MKDNGGGKRRQGNEKAKGDNKLLLRLSKEIGTLKAAKKLCSDLNQKLTAENKKLKKQLLEAEKKLKTSEERNGEIQGHLVLAVRKIEQCTKLFAENANKLSTLAENVTVGSNYIASIHGAEKVWEKKAQTIREILDSQPSGRAGRKVWEKKAKTIREVLDSQPSGLAGPSGETSLLGGSPAIYIHDLNARSDSGGIFADDPGVDSFDEWIYQYVGP